VKSLPAMSLGVTMGQGEVDW